MGDFFSHEDSSSSSQTNNDQIALNAGGSAISGSTIGAGTNIIYGDAANAKKALDTAAAIANSSYETIYYLEAGQSAFQDRALNTVDAAVAASQNIATQAAPVSPGNYAEAVAGLNTKAIITVAIVVGMILILANLKK